MKYARQQALLPDVADKRIPQAPEIKANDLNANVVALINFRGGFAWRNNTGATKFPDPNGGRPRFVRFGFKGSSDVLGVTATGRFIAVETKTLNDKLSDDQKWFLELVRQRGGIALVVGAKNWGDDLDALLLEDKALADAGLARVASRLGGSVLVLRLLRESLGRINGYIEQHQKSSSSALLRAVRPAIEASIAWIEHAATGQVSGEKGVEVVQ